jgi:universal stress protein E
MSRNANSHHQAGTSSGIRRILVAVKDPWARALPAVAKAAQLARASGARLELFHSICEPLYLDIAEFHGRALENLENQRRKRVLDRLELVAERLGRHRLTAHAIVEWDFPPHEAILRAARAFKADLIVAEPHPTSHHLPWLLRFTDFELLRCSPVPVLLVKARRPYARPKILAAVDPSHAYSKPVKLDDEILRSGSEMARALHGTLHAVYAFNPLPIAMAPESDAGEMIPDIEAAARDRARTVFERALRAAVIPRSRRHLVPRHPTDAIEEVAGAIGSDIVVMGAISRSGLKRLVLGETAEKLFDRLPCDLLVVKPRRFTNHIPATRRGAQLIALPDLQPGI